MSTKGTVCPGGVSAQGGVSVQRGVCPGGLPGEGFCPGGVCLGGVHLPPSVDRIVDTHL